MKLKVGQGFKMPSGYGLIMNDTGDDIEYISVYPIRDENGIVTHCYDDPGADPRKDRDNVRLKNCPPPFTDLSIESATGGRINNAYALADLDNIKTMRKICFENPDFIEILDNGKMVPPETMQEIRNHRRNNDQLQAEKIKRPLTTEELAEKQRKQDEEREREQKARYSRYDVSADISFAYKRSKSHDDLEL